MVPTDEPHASGQAGQDPILNGLTEAQHQAVTHRDGPLLVLAGPGSGKTRVVTSRVGFLLRSGIPADRIVALTFTNKAAEEMRRRVQHLVPGAEVWMGTFHRFCAQLLRRFAGHVGLVENFTIYDTDDSKQVLKRVMEQHESICWGWTPEQLLQEISQTKTAMVTAQHFRPKTGDALGHVMSKIYPLYQQTLLQSNAVDFDDLLLHVALLLRENKELRRQLDDEFRYVLVDEYQDTNLAQYAIARGLSIDFPNIAATGDPDQSIYGWRGANLNNILEFEHDYPQSTTIRLEQNYRSTPNILKVADALITRNVNRKKKALFTENTSGPPVQLNFVPSHIDEAHLIAQTICDGVQSGRRRARDFAVFYRANYLSRTIEQSLRQFGIPYQIVRGVEFYQRKEVRDIMAYLQLANNLRNDAALLRILNVPPRGIGRVTVRQIVECADQAGQPLFACLRTPELQQRLSKRARKAVAAFVELIEALRQAVPGSVGDLVEMAVERSGYRKQLDESGLVEDEARAANLEELIADAREFEEFEGDVGLDEYLERAALVNDVDQWDQDTDRVTLMTLHAAKGLEFPAVFIIAVEQGILPHSRNCEALEKLEEERRLFFVGITRAEQELYLSTALRRTQRGAMRVAVASEFLMDLPQQELEVRKCGNRMQPLTDLPEFQEPEGDIDQDAASSLDKDDYCGVSPGTASATEATLDQASSDQAAGPVPPKTGSPECRVSEQDPGAGRSSRAAIVTAASLLQDQHAAAQDLPGGQSSPPAAFSVGGTVVHPTYGPGKILSLGGTTARRTATVRFASTGEQLSFVIDKSPLRVIDTQ